MEGGNYSREETICGNTVLTYSLVSCEQNVSHSALCTAAYGGHVALKNDQRGKAFFRGARSGNALLTEATVRYSCVGERGR